MTDGDDAAVAIGVAWRPNDLSPPNVIRESEGGLLSATVGVPISSFAWLACFRRVYSEQPDALAVNLDRVAVDDGGRGRPCRLRQPAMRRR